MVGASNVEELPWSRAGRSGSGVCLILENSTACRKSMQCFLPRWQVLRVPGCFGVWVLCGVLSRIPLVTGNFGCLFAGVAFCWFSTESLILAQDERWRRA